MDTAALRSVFAQESAAELLSRWDDLAASLADRFPNDHWRKIWSTNLLERVNEEIKRCTRVMGIFPNDVAIRAFDYTLLKGTRSLWLTRLSSRTLQSFRRKWMSSGSLHTFKRTASPWRNNAMRQKASRCRWQRDGLVGYRWLKQVLISQTKPFQPRMI
jgi:hypothetical protein